MNSNPAITEAEGFAELELFTDAWDMIDDLPPAMRTHPEALRVRLMCCTGLEKWELGADLARLVGEAGNPLELRETAGKFHLAHARHLLRSGCRDAAIGEVLRLSISWPEGRVLVLDDPGLSGLL